MSARLRAAWRAAGARRRAAGLVVLLVVAAVFLALAALAGHHGHRSPITPTPPPVAPRARSAPASTRPAHDQALPVSPPDGIAWQLYQGIALPYGGARYGPQHIDGGLAEGYADSPIGALLALVQIGTRDAVSPGDAWRQVVEHQVLPGHGRDLYLSLRATVDNGAPPDGFDQIAGFRFVTYAPDAAVIALATRAHDGALQTITGTVRWADGDWRLELQPDGSESPTVEAVSTLDGFIPWSGV